MDLLHILMDLVHGPGPQRGSMDQGSMFCTFPCLSDIPPSGGTSRNEGIHKVLKKTLRKSTIGIQFALALLGIFFYICN